jgi:hypothetical protein
MASTNKPAVMGEFGITDTNRNITYASWYQTVISTGITGDLIWYILAHYILRALLTSVQAGWIEPHQRAYAQRWVHDLPDRSCLPAHEITRRGSKGSEMRGSGGCSSDVHIFIRKSHQFFVLGLAVL